MALENIDCAPSMLFFLPKNSSNKRLVYSHHHGFHFFFFYFFNSTAMANLTSLFYVTVDCFGTQYTISLKRTPGL